VLLSIYRCCGFSSIEDTVEASPSYPNDVTSCHSPVGDLPEEPTGRRCEGNRLRADSKPSPPSLLQFSDLGNFDEEFHSTTEESYDSTPSEDDVVEDQDGICGTSGQIR
jgi:hypothetical protein